MELRSSTAWLFTKLGMADFSMCPYRKWLFTTTEVILNVLRHSKFFLIWEAGKKDNRISLVIGKIRQAIRMGKTSNVKCQGRYEQVDIGYNIQYCIQ